MKFSILPINKGNKVSKNENSIILYQDENLIMKVSARFSNDDVWLTQSQIAEIYGTTQQNISQHIDGIYLK